MDAKVPSWERYVSRNKFRNPSSNVAMLNIGMAFCANYQVFGLELSNRFDCTIWTEDLDNQQYWVRLQRSRNDHLRALYKVLSKSWEPLIREIEMLYCLSVRDRVFRLSNTKPWKCFPTVYKQNPGVVVKETPLHLQSLPLQDPHPIKQDRELWRSSSSLHTNRVPCVFTYLDLLWPGR